MSFLFIFLGILILGLVIYYFNPSVDCFTNDVHSSSMNEIDNIRNNYNDIKALYANGTPNNDIIALQKKANIKNAFDNIENSLLDSNDKNLLNNNYYDITKYLDNTDDIEFDKIIANITEIVMKANNENSYRSNVIIDRINEDFSHLNDVYQSIYIDKLYNYNDKKEEINNLNKKIVDNLLLIIDYTDIYKYGIDIILNISLKQAYENDNMLEINNNKNSFNEKINLLKTQQHYNIPPMIETQEPINLYQHNLTVDIVRKDFNDIDNSFQMINNIYINKKFDLDVFITSLNNIIYGSIDNIANYYQYNNEYKNKIIAIKNTIIKPILDTELKNSYLQNDEIKINNYKIDFNNNINEIKNTIIGIMNNDLCLNNIINYLFTNQHPIIINKIEYCNKL
jgi:hypothetical protein